MIHVTYSAVMHSWEFNILTFIAEENLGEN